MLAFQFTVDEINMILTGLADQPYKNVAQLVSKIHSQANPQIQAAPIPQAPALPDLQGNRVTNSCNHAAGRQVLAPPSYAS